MANENFVAFPVVCMLIQKFLAERALSQRIKEFTIQRKLVNNIFEYDLIPLNKIITVKDMMVKFNLIYTDFILSSQTLIDNLSIVSVKCSRYKIDLINKENINLIFEGLEYVHEASYLTSLDKILKSGGGIRQKLEIIENVSSDRYAAGKAAIKIKEKAEEIIKLLSIQTPSIVVPEYGKVTESNCGRAKNPFNSDEYIYSVDEFREAVKDEYIKRIKESAPGSRIVRNAFYVIGEIPDKYGALIYVNVPESEKPKEAVRGLFKVKDKAKRPVAARLYNDLGKIVFDKYVTVKNIDTVFNFLFTEIEI